MESGQRDFMIRFLALNNSWRRAPRKGGVGCLDRLCLDCLAKDDFSLPDKLGVHVGENAVHVERDAQRHSWIEPSVRGRRSSQGRNGDHCTDVQAAPTRGASDRR